MSSPPAHRSGFVCLVGRPNVGKSTLLNAMVGQKVAIVTDVPGTTRNVIRGVVSRPDAQIVFLDTPGLARPRTLLNRRLNETVRATLSGVDLICLVVDAAAGIGRGDRYLAGQLRGVTTPVVCVVNKEDLVRPRIRMAPILEEAASLGDFVEIVPTSAVTGMNVAHLVDVIVSYLPPGPRYFPDDQVSDQPAEQLAAEIIREKYIARMRDEVPHSIAVEVEQFAVRPDGVLEIDAVLYVERPSQKAIVIGRGGQVLKEANTAAREELEIIFGHKVALHVWVKVARDWQRDPRRLERFGY